MRALGVIISINISRALVHSFVHFLWFFFHFSWFRYEILFKHTQYTYTASTNEPEKIERIPVQVYDFFYVLFSNFFFYFVRCLMAFVGLLHEFAVFIVYDYVECVAAFFDSRFVFT